MLQPPLVLLFDVVERKWLAFELVFRKTEMTA